MADSQLFSYIESRLVCLICNFNQQKTDRTMAESEFLHLLFENTMNKNSCQIASIFYEIFAFPANSFL